MSAPYPLGASPPALGAVRHADKAPCLRGQMQRLQGPRETTGCYLSQIEGEDLARRPCSVQDCPRHEGTQGLRSLWVKRTQLLRSGAGHTRPPGGTRRGDGRWRGRHLALDSGARWGWVGGEGWSRDKSPGSRPGHRRPSGQCPESHWGGRVVCLVPRHHHSLRGKSWGGRFPSSGVTWHCWSCHPLLRD